MTRTEKPINRVQRGALRLRTHTHKFQWVCAVVLRSALVFFAFVGLLSVVAGLLFWDYGTTKVLAAFHLASSADLLAWIYDFWLSYAGPCAAVSLFIGVVEELEALGEDE